MCVFVCCSNFVAVDTASAVAIALMTFGTMYPMSLYSGKVLLQVGEWRGGALSPLDDQKAIFNELLNPCSNHLLPPPQTTPSHVIGQLDKLLREVRLMIRV